MATSLVSQPMVFFSTDDSSSSPAGEEEETIDERWMQCNGVGRLAIIAGHFSPPSAVLRTTLPSPFCCSHSVLFVPKGAFRRRPSAQHCRHLFATEGCGQLAAASQGSAFRGKPSGLPPSSLAFAINIHLCAQLPRLWPRAAPAGAKMAGDGPKHDRHPLLSAFPRFPLLSPRRGQLHSHHSAISSVGPLPSLFGPKWTCSSGK